MADSDVWKSTTLVRTFLDGVRGGIPFAAAEIDVMLRLLAAARRPLERFADLGCGDGVLSAAILERWPLARGTLVDFSEPMIGEAGRRLERPGLPLQLVLADLGRAAWRDSLSGPFDAVVSGFAIHHLPDERKRELYGEIFELLEAGGAFVNLEHVSAVSPWIAQVADDHFIDSLYRFHRERGSSKRRAEIAEEYVHRPDKRANIPLRWGSNADGSKRSASWTSTAASRCSSSRCSAAGARPLEGLRRDGSGAGPPDRRVLLAGSRRPR